MSILGIDLSTAMCGCLVNEFGEVLVVSEDGCFRNHHALDFITALELAFVRFPHPTLHLLRRKPIAANANMRFGDLWPRTPGELPCGCMVITRPDGRCSPTSMVVHKIYHLVSDPDCRRHRHNGYIPPQRADMLLMTARS